jgi:hypothetical protein
MIAFIRMRQQLLGIRIEPVLRQGMDRRCPVRVRNTRWADGRDD